MEIRDLVAVAQLADHRNFGTVAELMNITQPTLSRIIAKLEGDLGLMLFRRGWNGVEATVSGELISSFARQVITAINHAGQKLYDDPLQTARLMHFVSLGHLEVIDSVSRNGSATAAGAELGRSQPSISRVLTDFQGYSGLVLFTRNQHGLIAQPDTQVLCELLLRIRNTLERLRIQIDRQKGYVTGRVAIGVLPFSGQDIIPRAFARLSQKYPLVRLVFVPGTYAGLVDALRLGEIEGFVGIMRGARCPADLTETRLFDEAFRLIARHDHPVHKRATCLEDLDCETWLVPPFGSPVRAFFDQLCTRYDMTPLVQTCEIQFFTAVEDMLAESNAIGVQTYGPVQLRTLRRDLKEIGIPVPSNSVSIALTTCSGAKQAAVFSEFQRLIMQMAEDKTPVSATTP